jgi:integrase
VVRGTLGTRSFDAALRLKNKLEIALSEGSQSALWPELSKVVPRRTYLSFASILGVKETKDYTWEDLCKSFRAQNDLRIKIDDLREATVTRYEAVIREFEAFLKEPERKISLLRGMDKELMKKFKFWRVGRIEEHSGTGKGIVTDIGALHTLFQHAVEEEMIANNPVQLEKTNRGENSEGGTDPFTGNELIRLRRHAGKDLTLVLLLRHTGLRKSDAVSVCFRVVDFDKRKLNLVTRKRRKRVILSLHPELMAALSAEYQRRNASPSDAILLNAKTGKPFTPASLYDHVVALGRRAGVPHAHPHRFRATYAVDLLHRGASTYHVAQALGDTEKVVIKHYTRFIPELGEQLRSFVENGRGLDEQPTVISLEGVAEHDTRSGLSEPNENLEPQQAYTPDIAKHSANKSDSFATARETDQSREHRAGAMICQTWTEAGKNSLGHNADSAAKRDPVAKRNSGAVVHGTWTAYEYYGCRCEICRTRHGDCMKEYRARRKADPNVHSAGTMVTLTCAECGKEFLRRKGNHPAAKGYLNAYCSNACYRKAAAKRGSGVVVHGTRTAYDRHGCRCEPCRAASSEHMKKYRARLKAEGREPMVTLTCAECSQEFLRRKCNSPAAKGTVNAYCTKTCYRKAAAKRGGGTVVHGTRTAYEQHGCRCEPCRAVHSEHMKKCRAATAKRKTVVARGTSGVSDQQEPCKGTDYECQVPAQAIRPEVINEQSCA